MESGNQCVLYEKLIKLSQNFNKHLKKTAKAQKIQKQEIIKNNEEFLKLITQQEIINELRREYNEEIREAREEGLDITNLYFRKLKFKLDEEIKNIKEGR